MKKLKHEAELIKEAIEAGVKYAEGRGAVGEQRRCERPRKDSAGWPAGGAGCAAGQVT